MMKKWMMRLLPLLLLAALLLTSCMEMLPDEDGWQGTPGTSWNAGTNGGTDNGAESGKHTGEISGTPEVPSQQVPEESKPQEEPQPQEPERFSIDLVPAYSGNPYVAVHDNIPYFTPEEITTESYEHYSELDSLKRCGVATACIGTDLMPTEPRGDISSVKPTGWVQATYDFVSNKYLYNRCHLIGFQLTGENANKLNLITGTRYLNISGMIGFENQIAAYIKETENHVMYRVTPVFEGNNLLASGVLMEALSVEDDGDGILFCVWCYNVQPGVVINYADGTSHAASATEQTSCTVVMFCILTCSTSGKRYF